MLNLYINHQHFHRDENKAVLLTSGLPQWLCSLVLHWATYNWPMTTSSVTS